MDLFEMLKCLVEMTNCFFLTARIQTDEKVIERFVQMRDRASDLLSQEAQKEEENVKDI